MFCFEMHWAACNNSLQLPENETVPLLNPIQSVLWNYVKECGGAIMARIDLGILKP